MKPVLEILPDEFAVCQIDSSIGYEPDLSDRFFSITKTSDELSVVCLESEIPPGSRSETGWRGFKVKGPLDFGLTGVLAGISGVLAVAEISIFAISTFDTDYVLVKADTLTQAISVLEKAGYLIVTSDKCQTGSDKRPRIDRQG